MCLKINRLKALENTLIKASLRYKINLKTNVTDHFVELYLSIQICLHVVPEVRNAMLMKVLCLGHQTVRDDIGSGFCFLQFKIADFARIFLVLQLCHNALRCNTTLSLHVQYLWTNKHI